MSIQILPTIGERICRVKFDGSDPGLVHHCKTEHARLIDLIIEKKKDKKIIIRHEIEKLVSSPSDNMTKDQLRELKDRYSDVDDSIKRSIQLIKASCLHAIDAFTI